MALIAMCVYVTETNNKADCFLDAYVTIGGQLRSEDRLFLSINGITPHIKSEIEKYKPCNVEFIYNEKNLGTAEGLNQVIRLRKPGENVIKIDDDIVVHHRNWIELLEEAVQRDQNIGVCGLKRRDLIQTPFHPDPQFRSTLQQLTHLPGQRWVTIERTPDIIGSCTLFNHALLDKVGYSKQFSKYGFEDNLLCHRSHIAGFYNCFLVGVDIEHLDPGEPEYTAWKGRESSSVFPEYHRYVHAMIAGTEPIYYNPFES